MNAPVLFIVFNRPDTTEKVFKAIRSAHPNKLFIAADGPRPDVPGETEKVKEVRRIVSEIDWQCDVKTLFSDKNLGCQIGVRNAIDWFFEQVEEGIILEDDCLPEPSFFSFAELMLERFRNDSRMMMVAGTNFLFGERKGRESYFFSRYYAIWGWATWRRAWQNYERDWNKWENVSRNNVLKSLYHDEDICRLYNKHFTAFDNHTVDTWDIPWTLTCMINYGLSIVPVNNLISNIGITGVHYKGNSNKFIMMPVRGIDLDNLIHPETVFPDADLDAITFRNLINKKPKVIKALLKRIIKKSGLCS